MPDWSLFCEHIKDDASDDHKEKKVVACSSCARRAPSFGDEGVNDGRIVAITKVTSVHTRNDLIQDTPTEAPTAFDEIFTNAMLVWSGTNNDYSWRCRT